jgi:hypothetical protein
MGEVTKTWAGQGKYSCARSWRDFRKVGILSRGRSMAKKSAQVIASGMALRDLISIMGGSGGTGRSQKMATSALISKAKEIRGNKRLAVSPRTIIARLFIAGGRLKA